jgi:hypothetical protein
LLGQDAGCEGRQRAFLHPPVFHYGKRVFLIQDRQQGVEDGVSVFEAHTSCISRP